mmetsp:Transcript_6398/g.9352  ORF Transcript_6398/g.9352 Transcript_6398/m.9352 type:complete len:841 (+) Transcript_6398:164-2686(+)|eukprot:CAMPEP_0172433958 /NCGR_PEP_ID=MMETSP1064-20121228/70374_1 /TAXON_ID=202472 /ORGANISM="Aulacoseira subarctica , Strain CCAP 1002/5" /LENGTH=840 /DNA_ID=CAMNT_0013182151 /DNA_START=126 /DNA_END=2648 /DNA_ORIENTATION=-
MMLYKRAYSKARAFTMWLIAMQTSTELFFRCENEFRVESFTYSSGLHIPTTRTEKVIFAFHSDLVSGEVSSGNYEIRDTQSQTANNSMASDLHNNITDSKESYTNQKKNKYHDRKVMPWKANFVVSSKTQRRIQMASKEVSSQNTNVQIFDPAIRVLDALLTTPVEECNEVNAMCALTLSTKTIIQQISKLNTASAVKQENYQYVPTIQARKLNKRLNRLLGIVEQLIVNRQLNFRQLANAAWSAGKLFQLFHNITTFAEADEKEYSTTAAAGTIESLEKLLLVTVLPITEILSSNNVSFSTRTGEISMILWAFSQFKARVIPTGWLCPPTIARISLQKEKTNHPQASPGKDSIIFEQHSSFFDESSSSILLSEHSAPTNTSIQLLMKTAAEVLLTIDSDKESSNFISRNNVPKRVIGISSWSELSNIAYSYARSQYRSSAEGEALMKEICDEAIFRLTNKNEAAVPPLPWDVSLIVWSLGVMQAKNHCLGSYLRRLLDAIVMVEFIDSKSKLNKWNNKDILQLSIALAHSAIDDRTLLTAIFEKAADNVAAFQNWELTVLLWVQARLYLTSKLGEDVYSRFTTVAVSCLRLRMTKGELFGNNGLGSQEQANLVWSLTVLEEYSVDSIDLLRAVFSEASSAHSLLTQEHAHQLWQAFFLLKSECPTAVNAVPLEFANWLEKRWKEEKSRKKISSASHKSLSDTLKLMRVAHANEHDEDIDIAIVLKETSLWTSQASSTGVEREKKSRHRIGIEIDGPTHFVHSGKRALGHTVLKYRLLKHQGWIVVRVPYYEFDKIPFWASMERQRYLQRLLKTHPNLRFSGADVSEYKAIVHNRQSRYD